MEKINEIIFKKMLEITNKQRLGLEEIKCLSLQAKAVSDNKRSKLGIDEYRYLTSDRYNIFKIWEREGKVHINSDMYVEIKDENLSAQMKELDELFEECNQ